MKVNAKKQVWNQISCVKFHCWNVLYSLRKIPSLCSYNYDTMHHSFNKLMNLSKSFSAVSQRYTNNKMLLYRAEHKSFCISSKSDLFLRKVLEQYPLPEEVNLSLVWKSLSQTSTSLPSIFSIYLFEFPQNEPDIVLLGVSYESLNTTGYFIGITY